MALLNVDVAYHTMPYMDIHTLRMFSYTSRTGATWVQKLLSDEYDNALQNYVAHPLSFRNVLRLLQAVVSGPFALAFILRNTTLSFDPERLDIYVERGLARRMAKYLEVTEGYSLREQRHADHIELGLWSTTYLDKGSKRVEIKESLMFTALYPIPHLWSSLSMNYLTADTYCIAYPAYTLKGYGLINPSFIAADGSLRNTVSAEKQAYEARGFKFRLNPRSFLYPFPHTCRATGGCSIVRRFFGDRYCFTGTCARRPHYSSYRSWLPSDINIVWWRGGGACAPSCQEVDLLPERKEPEVFEVSAEKLPTWL
ncbi:hypothetical protein FKP32DRAFT_1753323 [Trametes sanguinea]|nr:hypothetical protein FKP32DRAFT_1753323 [Trametes sanguinea]